MYFKCYDRNGQLVMEEKNDEMNTIGFTEDGHTVLDLKVAKKLESTPELAMRIDSGTGKKFIFRDGKWVEILPAKNLQKNIVIKKIIKPVQFSISNNNKLLLCPITTSANSKLLSTGGKTRNIDCQTDNDFKEKCFIDNFTQTEYSSTLVTSWSSPCNLSNDLSLLDSMDTFLKSCSTDPFSVFCDNMLNPSGDNLNSVGNNLSSNTNSGDHNENKIRFFMDLQSAIRFSSSGNLPIHESVLQNDVNAVRKNCLILKAQRLTPNIRNHYNHSALQLAVLFGADNEIVRALLKFGADVSLLDSDGDSVFHLAAEHKRSDHMKLLLEHAVWLDIAIDRFNYKGYTPLILCCNSRSYENAKLLLEHGADVNLRDQKSGRTPLFHAIENFDLKMIELLLQYNADKKIRNFLGTSAHDAVFEIDDIPIAIKYLILGKAQLKRKIERDDLKKKKTNFGSVSSLEIEDDN